jgi:DNA-binding NtrC family response regulator
MPDAPSSAPRNPFHGRPWTSEGALLSPAPPSSTPTILVVDDQAAGRSLVCAMLQGEGYRTLDAADGLAAWQMLSAHRGRIQCLVTDFLLPGLNGGALVELARELWPHLPVLVISGQPHVQVTGAFPSLEEISFLRKPFHPDDLLAIVESMLTPRA